MINGYDIESLLSHTVKPAWRMDLRFALKLKHFHKAILWRFSCYLNVVNANFRWTISAALNHFILFFGEMLEHEQKSYDTVRLHIRMASVAGKALLKNHC